MKKILFLKDAKVHNRTIKEGSMHEVDDAVADHYIGTGEAIQAFTQEPPVKKPKRTKGSKRVSKVSQNKSSKDGK